MTVSTLMPIAHTAMFYFEKWFVAFTYAPVSIYVQRSLKKLSNVGIKTRQLANMIFTDTQKNASPLLKFRGRTGRDCTTQKAMICNISEEVFIPVVCLQTISSWTN